MRRSSSVSSPPAASASAAHSRRARSSDSSTRGAASPCGAERRCAEGGGVGGGGARGVRGRSREAASSRFSVAARSARASACARSKPRDDRPGGSGARGGGGTAFDSTRPSELRLEPEDGRATRRRPRACPSSMREASQARTESARRLEYVAQPSGLRALTSSAAASRRFQPLVLGLELVQQGGVQRHAHCRKRDVQCPSRRHCGEEKPRTAAPRKEHDRRAV